MKYMKLLINYIDFFIQEYNINNKNSTRGFGVLGFWGFGGDYHKI